MTMGHAVAQTHDANGNVMGRCHTNPIFGTMVNQVQFAGGEVTESTTNVIAESIHAQCDTDRNEYLLLDALVNYHKNYKVVSFPDQQISIWGRPVTSKITAGW